MLHAQGVDARGAAHMPLRHPRWSMSMAWRCGATLQLSEHDVLCCGRGVCDKVVQGESFAQVGDVKRDVTPNNELAAYFLVW